MYEMKGKVGAMSTSRMASMEFKKVDFDDGEACHGAPGQVMASYSKHWSAMACYSHLWPSNASYWLAMAGCYLL